MNAQKNKNLITKHAIIQSLLLAFIIFLTISVSLNAGFIQSIDNFVFDIASKIRCKTVDNIFLFITYLGETITIISFLIFLLIFPFRKKLVPLYCLVGISACTNYILKNLIKRARPIGQFVNDLIFNYPFPTSYSFPSGHSQNSLVVYFVSAYILLNHYYKGKNKNLILSLITILPVLVMISRIILGVHFFSDVLMGACLAILIISNYIFIDKHSFKKNAKQSWVEA